MYSAIIKKRSLLILVCIILIFGAVIHLKDINRGSTNTTLPMLSANSSLDPEIMFQGFNNETGVKEAIIPNLVHFVLFGEAINLDFTTFLCILAAIKVHRPSTVFLHSDSPLGANSQSRYWLTLKNLSTNVNVRLKVRHLTRPTHVFGQRLSSVWHASDVSRINILSKYGGLVLDQDQLVLKPLHDFRHFEMVLGWPEGEYIGTQLLMAHPKARLLRLWLDGYRHYRPSMWYYNAAQLPTQNLLSSRPELVHRERLKFGVHNLASKLYGSEPWPEWHQLSSIHLLSRHKYLLSSKDQALLPDDIKKLNESTIQILKAPFSEICRYILHEVAPSTLLL